MLCAICLNKIMGLVFPVLWLSAAALVAHVVVNKLS